jgi:hypothetical protein
MLNIPGLKGNASQNDTEIWPHSSQNDCNQEHNNKFCEDVRKKQPLYTVGGNAI